MKWYWALLGHSFLQIMAYYTYQMYGFEKTLIAIIMATGFYVLMGILFIMEEKCKP